MIDILTRPGARVLTKEIPGQDDMILVPEGRFHWRSNRKEQKIVDEFQIQVTDQPAETDWHWLEDSINQFNMQLTGYQDYRPLAIFVRDPVGAMIAGLTAF